MSKRNDGGPKTSKVNLADMAAYPTLSVEDLTDEHGKTERYQITAAGMSYRQWLAGMIAGGISACAHQEVIELSDEQVAEHAVSLTDALITELERTNG